MDFLRCPRCCEPEFEPFSGYAYCHACNYFEVRGQHIRTKTREKTKRPRKVPRLPLHRASSEDTFSEKDHEVVRRALLSIPEHEKRVVVMYFWKRLSIAEIASRTESSREWVGSVLNSAYARLRELCLKEPQFSRFIPTLITAA